MATVAPKAKTVVTMKLDGNCASHSRTDVSVRDLKSTIDEPAERGGTNQGLTPTETLMASLIGCTNVITHKVAEKNGVDIDSLTVKLEAQFDWSGADAWDPKAHPLVFITTEGPGYGGLLSGVKLPGLAIFDAETRKVVAHRNYDVLKMGFQNVFEPHGLGVSPDGKWIYLATGEGSFGTLNKGAWLIINARTLKLDKVLRLQGNAHHASAVKDQPGRDPLLTYG